jgi:hypothetical protein
MKFGLLGRYLAGALSALVLMPVAQAATVQDAKTVPLALRAVVVEGAPALRRGVSFSLQRLDTGEEIPVSAVSDGTASIAVPNGRYRLKAAYGAAKTEEDILVDGSRKAHVVNFNAGEVSLRMIPQVGGPEIKRAIDWRVMTYGRDKQGRRVTLYEATAATAAAVLPQGWYVVHALDKGLLVKHVIEVTAGHNYTYTLVRN